MSLTRPSFRRVLHWLSLGFFLAAVILLCNFKILDRDFWWHITAGRLMWETGSLILTEPFAYTREGLPYLATHEWLAQIILYGVHTPGGTTGVILLRTFMMALAFGLLLGIDRRNVWPNAFLAIAAAGAAAGGFLERPQLFTFVIVAAELLLALRYLDRAAKGIVAGRRAILLTFVLLQVLWVNLHGGAALVGFLILGALGLQRMATLWREERLVPKLWGGRDLWLLLGTGLAFAAALLASPSGTDTLDYLHRLLTDKTIAFISEWRPREHGYGSFIGPFWVIGILAVAVVRRDWIFCLLVAGVTGYLSLRAVRHEMLFLIAATAVTIYQLKHAPWWQSTLDRLAAKPLIALGASVLAVLPVVAFAHASYRQVVERDHLWGYGVFAPAAGAADFVEREGITGKMFNTYGIGGYLIHRFFPDPRRKVFIDGRNVDYGFDFMNAAFVAGHTPEDWRAVEDKWNLSYAFIDYDAIKQPGWLSYSHILDADPAWPLVYIDDWTAVYLKDIPANRAAIERHRYRVLTAEGLEFGWALQKIPEAQRPELEAELRRAVESSPESVKARNLLAKLLLSHGRIDEMLSIAGDIERLRPHRPEAWALRAAAAMVRQDYAAAAAAFAQMLALAGDDYPDINYAVLDDVFAKAGRTREAERFRRRAVAAGQNPGTPAVPELQEAGDEGGGGQIRKGAPGQDALPEERPPKPEASPAAPAGDSCIGDLLSGMQEDIETFNDQGVVLAQDGRLDEAREAFMHALMLDPGNPLTLSNLCALEMQDGNLEQSIEYGRQALERGGEFADAHFNLALALLKIGDVDGARREANRADDLGRDVSELLRAIDDGSRQREVR